MLPITRMISKYNHYDYNNPKYLILHYTGNDTDTALNNAKYFNGGNRNASAHYFVDDNSIYQVVEDNKGAWHIGNTKTEPNNTNSIGIEMCCKNGVVTEKTEQNALELTKYLMGKYNIPIANVRTHAEVTKYGKICPNWQANDWKRWKNFKNKLNGSQTSKVEVQKVETVNVERKVKFVKDVNIWNDTNWKSVKGQVKKGRVVHVTKMTKDYAFYVIDGGYVSVDSQFSLCSDMNKLPFKKIMPIRDCTCFTYCDGKHGIDQLKAWEVFETIDYKDGWYLVYGRGWVHESHIKCFELNKIACTNGCV